MKCSVKGSLMTHSWHALWGLEFKMKGETLLLEMNFNCKWKLTFGAHKSAEHISLIKALKFINFFLKVPHNTEVVHYVWIFKHENNIKDFSNVDQSSDKIAASKELFFHISFFLFFAKYPFNVCDAK
jgi:hypothetical protein